jgi:hypothetical protein
MVMDGDRGNAIAVDSAGNAYVAGLTYSDIPTTQGAYQPNNRSGYLNGLSFVTKLNPTGSALVYSTYLGGNAGDGDAAYAIAVDATGSAYVTGWAGDSDFPTTDGSNRGSTFITKLNPSGSGLTYSTRLVNGGMGLGIALDSSGDAYVTGRAEDSGFPTINALQGWGGGTDAFVSELNASASALLFSTYLGGSGNDYGTGIALDSSGNIYVTGITNSRNFPTTQCAYQTAFSGNSDDAFVTKISVVPSPSFTVTGPTSFTAGTARHLRPHRTDLRRQPRHRLLRHRPDHLQRPPRRFARHPPDHQRHWRLRRHPGDGRQPERHRHGFGQPGHDRRL